MSTPEGPGAPADLPAETRLGIALGPSPTAVPQSAAPTPGVSPAVARVPGGPTGPDPDPLALAGVMARLGSEMLVTPPSAAQVGPRGPAGPPGSVPAAPVVSGVPPGGNPFATPLRWDQLLASLGTLVTTIPLVDAGPVSPTSPAPLPASPGLAGSVLPGHQLDPTTGVTPRPGAGDAFDPHLVRREFPILEERVHGRRLVWLDNAATTQKPRAVIDRLTTYYERENSNVHRAAHTLAARATDAYEGARESVRRFLNAPSAREIVFVRGATEAINLVAQAWGRRHVGADDEIVITWLEHHANIVPWQQLAAERGARLRVAPVDDRGQVELDAYQRLLGPRTKLVAFSQVSNALGTITPARDMIELAHRHGARVLVDGAQAVSHMPVDVQTLDCDFYVFSGHKVFAPTGIGALYGKPEVLEAMPPWQGGGNMIRDVTFERTTYQGPPARFEAGTGNIADAIGLGAALDWLSRIGLPTVERYEHALLDYATAGLATVPGLTLIGTAPDKAGVLSFVLAGQKTEEVGGVLDQEGIAVRSGHHCAQPILRRFGLEATVRASLALYNTQDDVDALVASLHRLQAGRPTRH